MTARPQASVLAGNWQGAGVDVAGMGSYLSGQSPTSVDLTRELF